MSRINVSISKEEKRMVEVIRESEDKFESDSHIMRYCLRRYYNEIVENKDGNDNSERGSCSSHICDIEADGPVLASSFINAKPIAI